jgi:gamma-glutamyl-gamma-aminobutyrate hydrolase PuuD
MLCCKALERHRNVALRGGLIADIGQHVPNALNHQRLAQAGKIAHEAALTAGSLLAKITGKQVMGVNSSHYQAVWQPAARLTDIHPDHRAIFRSFTPACIRNFKT